MRPYITHLMADLLMDPATACDNPGYVRQVVAAYAREISVVPAIKRRDMFGITLTRKRQRAR